MGETTLVFGDEPSWTDADIQLYFRSNLSLEKRYHIVRNIYQRLKNYIYSSISINLVWNHIQDFFSIKTNNRDMRKLAYNLMERYIYTQKELSLMERYVFFQSIEKNEFHDPSELRLKLKSLNVLTNEGHKISGIENKICPLLASWFIQAHQFQTERSQKQGLLKEEGLLFLTELFAFSSNLTKFQLYRVPEHHALLLISSVVDVCNRTPLTEVVEKTLLLFDALVRYSSVPGSAVNDVVVILCSAFVSTFSYSKLANSVVVNLFQSHISHIVFEAVIDILRNLRTNVNAVRGAVRLMRFFVLQGSTIDPMATFSLSSSIKYTELPLGYHESVDFEILGTVFLYLQTPRICSQISSVDWRRIFNILSFSSKYLPFETSETKKSHKYATAFANLYDRILDVLEIDAFTPSFIYFEEKLIAFFHKILPLLKTSILKKLVQYIDACNLTCPSSSCWTLNLSFLYKVSQTGFLSDQDKANVLKTIQKTCSLLDKNSVSEFYNVFLLPALKDLSDSEDEGLIAPLYNMLFFIHVNHSFIELEGLIPLYQQFIHSPNSGDITVRLATSSLVRLFYFYSDLKCKEQAFTLLSTLLSLLSNNSSPIITRSMCLQLFLRFRRNAQGIYLVEHLHQRASLSNASLFEESMPYIYPVSDSFINDIFVDKHHWGRSSSELFNEKDGSGQVNDFIFPTSLLLNTYKDIFLKETEWTIFGCLVAHFPDQLSNRSLFIQSILQIRELVNVFCGMISERIAFPAAVPEDVRKAHIMIPLLQAALMSFGYLDHFTRAEKDELVNAFLPGLEKRNEVCHICIHALLLCCYEMPVSISKHLPAILTRLSRLITKPDLSVHILEFLSSLARLPDLIANFTDADFRQVFGVSLKYIQHYNVTKSGKTQPNDNVVIKQSYSSYVLALAYNILQIWFLSVRTSERKKFVPWILRGLSLAAEGQALDDLSLVQYDMMQRFCYSNSDIHNQASSGIDPDMNSQTWIRGNSLFTVSVSKNLNYMQALVRRPSGTTQYTFRNMAYLRNWMLEEDLSSSKGLPSHNEFAPIPSSFFSHFLDPQGISVDSHPILLPANDAVRRAIAVFDRVPVIESLKAGVVYVGYQQTVEADILANTDPSHSFKEFLNGLGVMTELKGSKEFYTGGLDRENNIDGAFAYYWKDKVTQLVFHCTTLMPTNFERDPSCTMKKRHIGNDFVNIIFNESGLVYDFDTIPSQFSFVNIVISPEFEPNSSSNQSAKFFKVEAQTKYDIDFSLFNSHKIVSLESLPAVVRDVTLNAAVFSHIYHQGAGDYVSIWTERLRQLKRLRERFLPAHLVEEDHEERIQMKLKNGTNFSDFTSYL
ncbi:tuberin [Schizosaccharomyces cryophilus OY26]|uniref:Tuberin n=1 Tax=Schizosaccharomyces cryophilus (strain OY26 / ATCC MYA-4695 / CBS 11777 / NBRC 106824 / NRRL Y48691) TaxID=653667 RepID=S9W0U6_SCHCR|nr:tuberin [Schizosaccharomyces cryophilus OY26]EPY53483.1 tuberin [Schizosaccharomyces cryophilus OY26]